MSKFQKQIVSKLLRCCANEPCNGTLSLELGNQFSSQGTGRISLLADRP